MQQKMLGSKKLDILKNLLKNVMEKEVGWNSVSCSFLLELLMTGFLFLKNSSSIEKQDVLGWDQKQKATAKKNNSNLHKEALQKV